MSLPSTDVARPIMWLAPKQERFLRCTSLPACELRAGITNLGVGVHSAGDRPGVRPIQYVAIAPPTRGYANGVGQALTNALLIRVFDDSTLLSVSPGPSSLEDSLVRSGFPSIPLLIRVHLWFRPLRVLRGSVVSPLSCAHKSQQGKSDDRRPRRPICRG